MNSSSATCATRSLRGEILFNVLLSALVICFLVPVAYVACNLFGSTAVSSASVTRCCSRDGNQIEGLFPMASRMGASFDRSNELLTEGV